MFTSDLISTLIQYIMLEFPICTPDGFLYSNGTATSTKKYKKTRYRLGDRNY